ncbi:hypothetical protein A3F37_02775 [Candidatus Saccharibacteria bacterium RIFCSPHIGHO2_12_FULL_41_12]|nr:MAG: hypothetical protein A3F37_02775 [Candidatus Saccharibacteria bacterium RIFCSPHIGHO2_12_FULL_41_12]
MIEAVIFDVDGVMIDSLESNAEFFSELFNKTGHEPLTAEQYRPYFHHNMKKVIQLHTSIEDEEEINRIWELGKNLVVRDRSFPSAMPDLEKTIIELSKNYRLGIVTSRIRDSIFKIPDLVAMQNYFKVVVAYEDTDKHKPDPTPLLLAGKKLGILPENCVYVGDTHVDVQAAKSAGMKSILFAQHNAFSADASTDQLAKLPEIIKG